MSASISPNTTEELPLTSTLRAILNLEARHHRETYLKYLGWSLFGLPIGLATGFFGGGGSFYIVCLLFAAILPLITGIALRQFDQATQRHADQQTYLRSSGKLTLKVIDGGGEGDTYQLEVCGRVLPLPEKIALSVFGVYVNSGGVPVKGGMLAHVVGTVAHDIHDQVIFTITDAEGRTLYRHPSLPPTR